MKKIYYEKVGRRYKPVLEYDNDLLDAFPKGNHLVSVYPGGSSRRYKIDPNYASLIAAGRVAEEAICTAMIKASELKPTNKMVTPEQRKAWDRLAKAFGNELATLQGPSVREIAEAGINAMIDEADKLMSNPTVRKAYERFLIVAELAKEKQND